MLWHWHFKMTEIQRYLYIHQCECSDPSNHDTDKKKGEWRAQNSFRWLILKVIFEGVSKRKEGLFVIKDSLQEVLFCWKGQEEGPKQAMGVSCNSPRYKKVNVILAVTSEFNSNHILLYEGILHFIHHILDAGFNWIYYFRCIFQM